MYFMTKDKPPQGIQSLFINRLVYLPLSGRFHRWALVGSMAAQPHTV